MRSSTMGNRGLGDAHCGRSRGGLVLRRLAIWVIFYWEFRVACPRGIHLQPYSRPSPPVWGPYWAASAPPSPVPEGTGECASGPISCALFAACGFNSFADHCGGYPGRVRGDAHGSGC